jgi:hypothetical protein
MICTKANGQHRSAVEVKMKKKGEAKQITSFKINDIVCPIV